MSILAAVIGPNLFRSVDDAFAKAERANLEGLSDGLRAYVLDNKRIPSGALGDWTEAIAEQIDLPEAQVQNNSRDYRRAAYFDPRFFTSTDTPFGGYTQTTGLNNAPVSPRVILVSDLTRNAPAAPTTSATFNAIWDQTPGAMIEEGPKVYIQRINLRSAFHRVILNNQNTSQPGFSLEAGSLNAVPGASGGVDGSVTRHILDQTELRLFQTPFPTGALETSALIYEEKLYRFTTDGSNWFWERS